MELFLRFQVSVLFPFPSDQQLCFCYCKDLGDLACKCVVVFMRLGPCQDGSEPVLEVPDKVLGSLFSLAFLFCQKRTRNILVS